MDARTYKSWINLSPIDCHFFARWKARDENDIEKALLRLDVNKSSDSVDIVLSSDDTPLFDSARFLGAGKHVCMKA